MHTVVKNEFYTCMVLYDHFGKFLGFDGLIISLEFPFRKLHESKSERLENKEQCAHREPHNILKSVLRQRETIVSAEHFTPVNLPEYILVFQSNRIGSNFCGKKIHYIHSKIGGPQYLNEKKDTKSNETHQPRK